MPNSLFRGSPTKISPEPIRRQARRRLRQPLNAFHEALSFLPEFAQSRRELDHQSLKKHQMSKRQFEDDSSCVSKGSPSADQPSKPSVKMATAAAPSWSRMLAAIVARNPSWQ